MTNEERRTVIEVPNLTSFLSFINKTNGRNPQSMVKSLDASTEVRTTDPGRIQYILYLKSNCCFPCKSLLRKKMSKFQLSSTRNMHWVATDKIKMNRRLFNPIYTLCSYVMRHTFTSFTFIVPVRGL